MADEYIRKADVLNLPQSIERNLRGEIVERSIDVKDIEALKPADVVPVIRCRDCKNRDEEDGLCTGRGWPCQLVPDDGFYDKGKRREEQANDKT